MDDIIDALNELEAVKKLLEITKAEFVYIEGNYYSAAELLSTLYEKHDENRIYILDNGPMDNAPGVYKLNDEGEISNEAYYAPAEMNRYKFGQILRISEHVDF